VQVPELVAHRGFAGAFPENSLAAVRAALELGARWVEIDVQVSKDEQVVLFHDRTLNRVCGIPGAIHEYPLEKLRELRLREPDRFGTEFENEPIAELHEVVELFQSYSGAMLFVEIKRIAIEQHGAALVLDKVREAVAPLAGRVILISFSHEFLQLASTQFPIGFILENWEQAGSDQLAELAPEFVFCNYTKFPEDGNLELPARLVAYEVVDPDLAVALAARGVELVETFQLADMMEALE
jgi:glycerophosphoryl diester phosphodiesterase